MADKITIDISILQGIFGDLTKLQQQLTGVSGGVVAVDRSFDGAMRNIAQDILGPTVRVQELTDKLADLGGRVRTSKSVGEIVKLKQEIKATQTELDRVNTGGMEQKVSGGIGRMRTMFRSLVAPIAGVFAVAGITSFANGVVQAAGAQQQFDVALKNMLQSKERADALGAQVKTFATVTPFSLTEVQDATKKLLAYGFSAQETIPTLRKLGDVAAGLGQPVGDIAYLYGTARVQGRLFSNDLNQFTNRGIPILGELAKVLGVSTDQVRTLTAEGKVGFSALEKAFDNLTAKGSQFGGLMEESSRTITGQLSNLGDAWGQFKTDMGLSLAPLITGVIAGLNRGMDVVRNTFSWLEHHGPLVKGILTGIAIVTGLYTTALLVNNAGLIANNALQAIAALRMGVMAAVMNVVTAATTIWTGVQWLLNAALNANPIGLVVIAIAALVGAVLYAWNHFEGFRGFLYGLWASVKVTFEGIKSVVTTVFGVISDIVVGFGKTLWGAFTGNWDLIKEGIAQGARGVKAAVDGMLEAPAKIAQNGLDAGKAYAEGRAKGIAAFPADHKDATQAAPGSVNAKSVVPGSNVGAASLVGGTVPGVDSALGAGAGSGTGSGKGGGDRNISMNITIHNAFGIGRNSDTDAKGAADKVVAMLVNKLRDAEFAIG